MRKILILCSLALAAGQLGLANEYQVEIPKSQIDLSDIEPSGEASTPGSLAVGASSWVPRDFATSSRIATTSSFERAGFPSLYANYLLPVASLSGLKAKAGLNWVALTRQGKLTLGNTVTPQEQTVQLISFRLGGEYSFEMLRIRQVLPYAGFSLLPSFAVSSRSSFDEGTTHFGVPVELTLGSRVSLKSMGISWSGAELDLGVIGTAGSVDHSSVAGLGVSGGVRVAL